MKKLFLIVLLLSGCVTAPTKAIPNLDEEIGVGRFGQVFDSTGIVAQFVFVRGVECTDYAIGNIEAYRKIDSKSTMKCTKEYSSDGLPYRINTAHMPINLRVTEMRFKSQSECALTVTRILISRERGESLAEYSGSCDYKS